MHSIAGSLLLKPAVYFKRYQLYIFSLKDAAPVSLNPTSFLINMARLIMYKRNLFLSLLAICVIHEFQLIRR